MATPGPVNCINVTDPAYAGGAIPNDGQPDQQAINAAFNAGQCLYFPAGTYNYEGSMILAGTLGDKSFRLYGDGPGVSTIIYTGAYAGGINAPNMGSHTLEVEGLTLQANSSSPVAISAFFTSPAPNNGEHPYRSATIHNVQIKGSSSGDGTGGANWTNGIHLYRATHTVIDKVEIIGKKNVTEQGIWLESPVGVTTGFNMSNLQVKWCNTALKTSGHVEGIYLTGFEFTECGTAGAPAVDLIGVAGGGAFHLVNGAVKMVGDGLKLTNAVFSKISNVRFIHAGPASGSMVSISGGFDATVSQCSFYGAESTVTAENGISVNGTASVRITGNNFTHLRPQTVGNGVYATGNCPALRIIDNLFSDFVIAQPYNVSGVTGTPAPYFCGNDPSVSNNCNP